MPIRVRTSPASSDAGDPRVNEPVTFGVPLPRGLAVDAANWALQQQDGSLKRLQGRVLDRWADGTARWVLVDAQIDTDGSAQALSIQTTGVSAPPAGNVISVSDSSGVVTVDTGPASFKVQADGPFPFASVRLSGAEALDSANSNLFVTDRNGIARAVAIRRVAVEEAGFLRTVVRLEGTVNAGAGRDLSVVGRLHFFAGLSTVRLSVTLTNRNAAQHSGGFWDLGDPGSVLVSGVTLRIATPGHRGAPAALTPLPIVTYSAEPGGHVETASTPLELYQDSSGGNAWQSSNHINRDRRVPHSLQGYRLKSGGVEKTGLRATPIVQLACGDATIGVAVPCFWQNFPKSIEVDERGLTLGLFPAQFDDLHEIQGGEQKTHECYVAFGPDGVSSLPLNWCRSPTQVSVEPSWIFSSGAVPFLAPLRAEHSALVDAAVDGPDRFEMKREVIDEYGWRHFGEIYGDHESVRQKDPPIVSHYNNQYDPVAGFIYQYLRSGDPRWWRMACELASHVIDIDVYHSTLDKSAYNHGLFWHTYHYGDADTATHRTYPSAGKGHTHGGGPSADHNYTTGLMLHYFLTGEPASKQTVIELAQYVIDIDDGRKTVFRWLDKSDTGRAILSAGHYGPGRSPANSLNALVDGHRTSGDRRFLEKAEQLLRRVVHPHEDITRHRLDDAEGRWFYTMFMQALGKYLHYKVEIGERDSAYAYARASYLAYARWMAEHEIPYLSKPEKLEFPTETWAAQDIRKSDAFLYAAMHSSGDERERFIERARFFHNYSLVTLAAAPTRTLARPIIVLLTSGFLASWFDANPSVSEPQADRPVDFGKPAIFTPQRERAKRRLVWIGGALAATAVAALVAVIFLAG